MDGIMSRRNFLRAGMLAIGGGIGSTLVGRQIEGRDLSPAAHNEDNMSHPMPTTVGEVNHERNGFNPSDVLTDFDYGQESTLENGQTLREYRFIAQDKDLEIAPGIDFLAWTYNGRVPGPTIRCTEGDRIRIEFINASSHAHTIHFHGIHTFAMDGVPGTPGFVEPGGSFVYEFNAEPFGLHLYHCHAFPLARHIAKGLYGGFIVDPKEGRPPVDREFMMMMNGFDVDFDNQNDFYAVNSIPFHYQKHPVQIHVGEKVRVYLVNILEFDLVNSFHLHANFFHYYPTGTSLTPIEYTDTIMQTQAQRGILEFSYKYPGLYMFHAHNTEFAELGWTGNFEVLP